MLIDSTYFINDINLDTGTYSDINASIEKYEKEIIEKLFDYADSKLILADDSVTWVQNVINGTDYTVNGETYNWVGLVNDSKESLIAYYVYYYHLRNKSSITGGVGNAQAKLENSRNISFNQKIGSAWIKLEKNISSLCTYLSNEYPEVEFAPYIGNVNIFDL